MTRLYPFMNKLHTTVVNQKYDSDEEESLGTGPFLNYDPLVISKALRGVDVVLPCRTNEFIENGVELFINHKKQTSGIKFDPRYILSGTHEATRNSLLENFLFSTFFLNF